MPMSTSLLYSQLAERNSLLKHSYLLLLVHGCGMCCQFCCISMMYGAYWRHIFLRLWCRLMCFWVLCIHSLTWLLTCKMLWMNYIRWPLYWLCCSGDVRNDIYVTLMQGELRRGAGGKVADKNVEVTIMVCNQDGEVIPVNILIRCDMLHWHLYNNNWYNNTVESKRSSCCCTQQH